MDSLHSGLANEYKYLDLRHISGHTATTQVGTSTGEEEIRSSISPSHPSFVSPTQALWLFAFISSVTHTVQLTLIIPCLLLAASLVIAQ
jgi:hypothetical protein